MLYAGLRQGTELHSFLEFFTWRYQAQQYFGFRQPKEKDF